MALNSLDRGVVVAILQVTDLDLVDALELVGVQAELVGDLGGGLDGPSATECATIAGGCAQSAGERAGLIAAEVGQRGAGRPGVQPPLDVAVRLSVPDQHQPTTHGCPSRSRVSQRAASSDGGGTAPTADPVGHDPR